MKQQVHVLYSGRVQGVGFRMAVEEAAQQFGVTGWGKNLRDGRVEVVAEAPEAGLKRFLEAVRTGAMKNFINQAEASWGNASEAFTRFEIRYY